MLNHSLMLIFVHIPNHNNNSADVDVIVNQIVFEEPLISESKKPHLRRLIYSKSLFI